MHSRPLKSSSLIDQTSERGIWGLRRDRISHCCSNCQPTDNSNQLVIFFWYRKMMLEERNGREDGLLDRIREYVYLSFGNSRRNRTEKLNSWNWENFLENRNILLEALQNWKRISFAYRFFYNWRGLFASAEMREGKNTIRIEELESRKRRNGERNVKWGF